ncbi:MAG: NAD(P)H-hydrate dehydratase [Acetatifactor sp.]|nr:NAD(P)H-hydrate dehydratase [Acetatifactor sp.]
MKYLVTAEEMRRYDTNTIEKIGIPSMVLMERAALAALEAVERHCAGEIGSALVLAGMGNNGGDGLALARLLCEQGFRVEVWCVGAQDKASAQWKQQREILKSYPVEMVTKPGRREYTVVIDALFGVGLSREVDGIFREAITAFGKLSGYKIALDLPSGVDSDTGRIWSCAVHADETVTFGFCKRGLVMYPGCEYAGKVTVAQIGISERSFFGDTPGMVLCDETAEGLLPSRRADGNKGTFGKVLLVAGSRNMAGAAVLAAKAAYRIGAGMVKVITPEENRVILQETVPEALLGSTSDLEDSLEWTDVIALGPGIGKSGDAVSCLEQVFKKTQKPLILDADGLNLLSESSALRAQLAEQGKEGRIFILTPHVGELARLTGRTVSELKEDLPDYGMALASELHATVAAKDARTFVCGEKRPICVNVSGNSGMAVAGSGDVLIGVIAGLLAQGMEPFQATVSGVRLHGLAGDRVSERIGEHACMAGDVADALGREW